MIVMKKNSLPRHPLDYLKSVTDTLQLPHVHRPPHSAVEAAPASLSSRIRRP